jgi:protein-tyrosine phosphatase
VEEGKARLTGLDPRVRHYVRLQAPDGEAVVVAERLVPLDGAMNFRDLGGYRGADGRRVRWGRVYRSDNLGGLSDADAEMLTALDVRLVCDLRRDEERATAPNRLPDHPKLRMEHLPIGGMAAETATMTTRMMQGEIRDIGPDVMAEVYSTLLEAYADTFGTIVRYAADRANHAMVVHCTAGKDRTGVASALLLAALGVDDKSIVDDYELTTRFHSEPRLAELRPQLEAVGVDLARVETFFTAPRAVMELTLAGLRETWGSVESYLTGPAGVTGATLDALRAALLD